MSDEETPRPQIPVSTIALLIVMAGGALLLPNAFESQRPEREGERLIEEGIGEAPVVARIWQDPLTIVERYEEQVAGSERGDDVTANLHSMEFLQRTLAQRLAQEPGKLPAESGDQASDRGASGSARVAVLTMLVPGGHWPVDVESRTRERHAVMAALGRMHYRPAWDRRLGFLKTSWLHVETPHGQEAETVHLLEPGQESLYAEDALALNLPYEWFELDPTGEQGAAPDRPEHVMVLWVDSSFFGRHALKGVDLVLTRLLDRSVQFVQALRRGRITLRLLGPPDSTSLSEMAEWLESNTGSQPPLEVAPGGTPGRALATLNSPAPSPAEQIRYGRMVVDTLQKTLDASDLDLPPLPELIQQELAVAIAEHTSDPRSTLHPPQVRSYLLRCGDEDKSLEDQLRALLQQWALPTGASISAKALADNLRFGNILDDWRVELFHLLAPDEPAPDRFLMADALEDVLSSPRFRAGSLVVRHGLPWGLVDAAPDVRGVHGHVADLVDRGLTYLDPEIRPDTASLSQPHFQRLVDLLTISPDTPEVGGMAYFVMHLLDHTIETRQLLVQHLGQPLDSDRSWASSVVDAWQRELIADLRTGDVPENYYWLTRPPPADMLRRDIRAFLAELEQGRDRWWHHAHEYLMDLVGPARRRLTMGELLLEHLPVLQRELKGLLSLAHEEARDERVAGELAEEAIDAVRRGLLEHSLRNSPGLTSTVDTGSRQALWTAYLEALPRYLVNDDVAGLPTSWDLGALPSELDRAWDRPEAGAQDQSAMASTWLDWLIDTADERRAALKTTPSLKDRPNERPGRIPLWSQIYFELARWERDVAKHLLPNDARTDALHIQFRLERSLLEGLPHDLDRAPMLRRIQADLADYYTFGERFAAMRRVHITTALFESVKAQMPRVVPDFYDDSLHVAIGEWLISGRTNNLRRRLDYAPAAGSASISTLTDLGAGALSGDKSGLDPLSRSSDPRRDPLSPALLTDRAQQHQALRGRLDSALTWLQIINSHATASGERFEAAFEQLVEDDTTRAIRPTGEYVSTVHQDGQLISGVLQELQHRGLDLASDDHHVAIIGEWDTYYGSRLQATLSEELPDTRVHPFRYSRGLDGGSLGEPAEPTESQGQMPLQQLLSPSRAQNIESPQGESQFDYIRRLSSELRQLDRDLSRDGQRLFAIGVVGSDVYDKLLLLQALRPLLPDALFFTTDLNASLFHSEERRWSRNLLVASSYGLAAPGPVQFGTPPFRESYQTATFVGTQLALGGLAVHEAGAGGPAPTPEQSAPAQGAAPPGNEPEPEPPPFTDSLPVRLFEIGRDRAVDLGAVRPAALHATSPLAPEPPRDRPDAGTWGLIAAGALLLFLLLIAFSDRLQAWAFNQERLEPGERTAINVLIRSLAGGSLVWVAVLLVDGTYADFEPLSLLGGVSVWPTLLVRTVAISLGLYLLFTAPIRVARSQGRLQRLVCLDENGNALQDEAPPGSDGSSPLHEIGAVLRDGWRTTRAALARRRARLLRRLLRRTRHCHGIASWRPGDEFVGQGKVDGADLWREFEWRNRLSSRVLRVAPPAVILLALSLVFHGHINDELAPIRGPRAAWFNTLSGLLLWVVLISLTLFVIDVTRLFQRFILLLSSRQTDWGGAATDSPLVDGRGLPPEAAADRLDVELVARHSEVVGRLVLLPFLLIFLVVLSRNPFFDNWTWPWALVVMLGLLLTGALLSASLLRRTAERVRRRSLRGLRDKLSALADEAEPYAGPGVALKVTPRGKSSKSQAVSNATIRGRIELAIADIQRMQRGAFSSYGRSPVVQALGGVGLVALIESLVLMGL